MFRLFRRNRTSRQEQALAQLSASAERFRQAAERVSGAEANLFWDLAEAVERLSRHLQDNPAHLNPLRRLWVYLIPQHSGQALEWADQARRDHANGHDLAALLPFQGFLDLLAAADRACRERRYHALETTLQALETQASRAKP